MTFDEYWNSEYPPLYDVGKAVARAAWEAASLAAWIPATERLPEWGGQYLVCTTSPWMQFETVDGVHQTTYYPDNERGFEFSGDPGVTHWRPLPAHPQEQR